MRGTTFVLIAALALLTIPRWAAAQPFTRFASWNFNSAPPDGNQTTGSLLPSIGSGTVSLIGGVTGLFGPGNSHSEFTPPPSDNSTLILSNFPTQGTAPATAGLLISAPSPGPGYLLCGWYQRNSPQSSLYFRVDAALDDGPWHTVNGGNFGQPDDLSSQSDVVFEGTDFLLIPAGAATVKFRILSVLNPASGSAYSPADSSAAYSPQGTWEIDGIDLFFEPAFTVTARPAAKFVRAGGGPVNFIIEANAQDPVFTGSGPPQFTPHPSFSNGLTFTPPPPEAVTSPSADYVYHYTVTDRFGQTASSTLTATVFNEAVCASQATPASLMLPCLHAADLSSYVMTAAPPPATGGAVSYRWCREELTCCPYSYPELVPLDAAPSANPTHAVPGGGVYAVIVTRTGGTGGCGEGLPVISNNVVISGYTADWGAQGGMLGHDNWYDNNDFVAFLNLFFEHNPLADVGRQGGLPGPDGLFDNNDFIIFINLFFNEC